MPRSTVHVRRPSGVRVACLSALTLAFLVAPIAAAQDWVEPLDTFLERELGRASFPGAAVAVVSGDEVLYARGFGETRARGGEAVTPRTSFEIGSLTKSMTALAILHLEERGRLELDDPVQRHLPWFRVADEAASARITVRHLLTHESGLPTTSHAIVRKDPERIDPSIEEGVRALADVELAGPPGAWFAYANTGYATLGAVVEAVSGESWFDYVETRILEPLGMEDAGTTIASQARLDMARPHTWRLGTRVEVASVRPFLAPSGSLQTASARDMAAYLRAWLRPEEGGVVTPRAAALATRPLVHVGDEFFGFGWIDANLADERLVYHTGGTAGSTSYMALLPGHDLGVVVLGNAMSTLAPTLGRGVVEVVLGDEPGPVGPDIVPILSRSVAAVVVVALVLSALLVQRVVSLLRRGPAPRRRWALAVRAAALSLVAVAAWIGMPRLLAEAGLPAPFGLFGYPFDFAVGSVAILATSTLSAIYAVARLVLDRRSLASSRRSAAS